MSVETFVISVFAAGLVTFSLMFLPSLVELVYPKDAGPRVITGGIDISNLLNVKSLEEDCRLGIVELKKLSGALELIPNLEQSI